MAIRAGITCIHADIAHRQTNDVTHLKHAQCSACTLWGLEVIPKQTIICGFWKRMMFLVCVFSGCWLELFWLGIFWYLKDDGTFESQNSMSLRICTLCSRQLVWLTRRTDMANVAHKLIYFASLEKMEWMMWSYRFVRSPDLEKQICWDSSRRQWTSLRIILRSFSECLETWCAVDIYIHSYIAFYHIDIYIYMITWYKFFQGTLECSLRPRSTNSQTDMTRSRSKNQGWIFQNTWVRIKRMQQVTRLATSRKHQSLAPHSIRAPYFSACRCLLLTTCS